MKHANFYIWNMRRAAAMVLLCCTVLLLGPLANLQAQPPKADLDQARNGNVTNPISPVNWVNGNAGAQNSHYIEGHSIPYRVVMTNLPIGTPITITLGYDIKHSGRHAIDFITHYQNLEPHFPLFGHGAEVVDPRIGYEATTSATANTWPIPVPPMTNTPVPGEPAATFLALDPDLRLMSLFGGDFSGADPIAYVGLGDLSAAQSEVSFSVSFVPTHSTAILAWGGHIGTRFTWGEGNSAGGISGSPYHTRLKGWSLGTLGNQDRSLSAAAVYAPPPCDFSGPESLCLGEEGIFSLDETNPDWTYAWSLIQNGTNAFIVGSNSGPSVTVNSGTQPGSFTVEVTVSIQGSGFVISSVCSTEVFLADSPDCDISGSDVVCPGSTEQYSGPANLSSYAWSISGDGQISGPTDQSSVTVIAGSACPGSYTLTLITTNEAGCESTCQMVVSVNDTQAPVISGVGGPLTIACDEQLVFSNPSASDNCDPDPLLSYEDVTTPGDCPQNYSVTRTWTATDACGNSSQAWQTITVVDDVAPVISGVGASDTIFCPAVPEFSEPWATDNCDPDPSLTYEDDTIPGECENEYTVTRTWTAVDACGNTSTAFQTITVLSNTPPQVVSIEDVVLLTIITFNCDEEVVIDIPEFSSDCDPDPVVSFSRSDGGEWGDPFAPGITTVCFWATDICGNVSDTVCVTIEVLECGDVFCSLTQGFYGNEGGTFCDGLGTVDLINELLGDEGLLLGHNGNTMFFGPGEALCVIGMLPGGGPAQTITGVNTCANHSGVTNNSLFAQTLTLGLNLRLDEELGDVALTSTFWTAESSDCNEEGATPVPDTELSFTIPQSVYDYLLGANGSVTPQGIYDLANLALGQANPSGASLSDIAEAADAINMGFDECRFLAAEPEQEPEELKGALIGGNSNAGNGINLSTYPNPFNSVAIITFSVPESGYARLDVYALTGVRVATLFDGYATAGKVYNFELNGADNLMPGSYITVIRTQSGSKHQKLLKSR
jgi:hypothetical protein